MAKRTVNRDEHEETAEKGLSLRQSVDTGVSRDRRKVMYNSDSFKRLYINVNTVLHALHTDTDTDCHV